MAPHLPKATFEWNLKGQKGVGFWVTQEKGKKNIPGGGDSMSKGRDAENKGVFGETGASWWLRR